MPRHVKYCKSFINEANQIELNHSISIKGIFKTHKMPQKD